MIGAAFRAALFGFRIWLVRYALTGASAWLVLRLIAGALLLMAVADASNRLAHGCFSAIEDAVRIQASPESSQA